MSHSFRLSCFSLVVVFVLAACGDDPVTVQPAAVDTTSVMVTLALETVAGGSPFALKQEMVSAPGAIYKTTKLRFYLSQPALIGPAGDTIPLTLLDSAGAPLPYNLLLVDYGRPESQTIRFLARQKSYRGILLSLGVPIVDATGDSLNHGDASLRQYPLDIDADMYWAWNPGYVFLKMEGQVQTASGWAAFSYHVGGDQLLNRIPLIDSLVVGRTGASRTIRVDVNRLFITPAGNHSPDITVSAHVNGGPMALVMATNAAGSGFLSIKR
jgi:hypothetical protein